MISIYALYIKPSQRSKVFLGELLMQLLVPHQLERPRTEYLGLQTTLPLLYGLEVATQVVIAFPQLPALPSESQLRLLELHTISLQQLAQPLHLPLSLLPGLIQLTRDAGLYGLYIMMQLGDLHLVGRHFLPEGFHSSFDEVDRLAHGFQTCEKRWFAVNDIGEADSQSAHFAVFPGGVGSSFGGEKQLIKRVHIANLGIIGCILWHFSSKQLSPLVLPHRIAGASAPRCMKGPGHLLHLDCLEIGGGQKGRVAVLDDLVLDGTVLVGWGDFSCPGKHVLFTLKLLLARQLLKTSIGGSQFKIKDEFQNIFLERLQRKSIIPNLTIASSLTSY